MCKIPHLEDKVKEAILSLTIFLSDRHAQSLILVMTRHHQVGLRWYRTEFSYTLPGAFGSHQGPQIPRQALVLSNIFTTR